MSAIGVSPCPPFSNRAGLPPGLLWDGNTVAWYKHNDSVAGVIKDGANRASVWFDKINYGIGAELVNQATWYTAAYWNLFDANWSQVGATIHSNGNNGSLRKDAFWTLFELYKITVTVVVNAGTLNICYDGTVISGAIVASGTYTYYYRPTFNAGRMYVGSLLFDGDIIAISIKQITGKHLYQYVAASQPLWSAANGVLFDGGNDYMYSNAFIYNQPEFIYFVGKQVTWTLNDYIFDGNAVNTAVLNQTAFTPELKVYAGAWSGANNNMVLNTLSIVRVLINGANSSLQINNTAAVVGNFGAAAMSGFTLGSAGNVITGFSNIQVKEIILRRTADNAATQASIYNYLKAANAVP